MDEPARPLFQHRQKKDLAKIFHEQGINPQTLRPSLHGAPILARAVAIGVFAACPASSRA
jgi:hypothetical protein